MDKYVVHLFPVHHTEYEVDAENYYDAIEKAHNIFDSEPVFSAEYAQVLDDFCVVDKATGSTNRYDNTIAFQLDKFGDWIPKSE